MKYALHTLKANPYPAAFATFLLVVGYGVAQLLAMLQAVAA